MAELAETIDEMKTALRKKLGNKASEQLITRLAHKLDDGASEIEALKSALLKVRTVLNLFVGEDQAIAVHRHLTQIAVARGHLSQVNETLY